MDTFARPFFARAGTLGGWQTRVVRYAPDRGHDKEREQHSAVDLITRGIEGTMM
jgi:hypothetical protein